jgi:tRNA (uracil-5-)-methyltransferase TRM9
MSCISFTHDFSHSPVIWDEAPALPLRYNCPMDAATIARLNQINRDFYRVTADEFDQTRGESWPGWERLLPHLHTPLSILDVGCGNGRFGLFLAESLNPKSHDSSPPLYEVGRGLGGGDHAPLIYHGIDSSPALLNHARVALENIPSIRWTLEARDIVENPPDSGDYDLVVLFGVLHHIPGYAERQIFMRKLAERVKSGGLLAFACWRFYEYERFRQRIIPWPDEITVEPGDYLLDWRRGETALRYCHYADDAEHAALLAASGMREILTYRADGQTRDANRYSLLQK